MFASETDKGIVLSCLSECGGESGNNTFSKWAGDSHVKSVLVGWWGFLAEVAGMSGGLGCLLNVDGSVSAEQEAIN